MKKTSKIPILFFIDENDESTIKWMNNQSNTDFAIWIAIRSLISQFKYEDAAMCALTHSNRSDIYKKSRDIRNRKVPY